MDLFYFSEENTPQMTIQYTKENIPQSNLINLE